MPNIKFATIVEQRLLNILLDDECPQTAIATPLLWLETQVDVVKRVADTDSIASVAKLSRLQYPNILLIFAPFPALFQLVIVVDEIFVLLIVCAFGNMEGER